MTFRRVAKREAFLILAENTDIDSEYYFPCDPEELSMLNHECTAPADDPYRVYVFQQMIIPNAVDSQGKAITEQVLSSWDSETNEFISICPTTDIYNPETQKGPMSSAVRFYHTTRPLPRTHSLTHSRTHAITDSLTH